MDEERILRLTRRAAALALVEDRTRVPHGAAYHFADSQQVAYEVMADHRAALGGGGEVTRTAPSNGYETLALSYDGRDVVCVSWKE